MKFSYEVIEEPTKEKYPFNPNQTAQTNEPDYRFTQIARSQRILLAKIPSTGAHYLYGPSSQYDMKYPPQLDGYINQEEYNIFINDINSALEKYWPCTFTFVLAYSFCIITAFCSLFLPKVCLDDVTKFLHYALERWNETWNPRGIMVDWKRSCLSSYLEITIVKNQIEKQHNELDNGKSVEQDEETKSQIELQVF